MNEDAEKKKIYLAGPEVFLPDAREIGQRKKELCANYGFRGLFPFDNEVSLSDPEAPLLIYRANLALLRQADCGIFNLTPFRGPSADVGTAFELGLLAGLGTPAFGYSNERASMLERMQRDGQAAFDESTSVWRDASGLSIEDFDNADNLMLDACLAEQGRPLVRTQAAAGHRLTDLAGFELCLELARDYFASAASLRTAARAF
ncbi:nucleoside 2-deoxyribosyltransferase [Methylocella silvestris BL2]|uniref:Nucleoside 2-deoxyribosyltransferase n=1 Tax=Methylocella silvestris (strain DSM 15510 / CIP 108128 / LMG 27833 / NCIMB 13906 / BL2) TaxID=395965 RepID=B8EI97_METSB|nr:nucleoside 2-deoxyribosyltransferase [Methylocella silvestris]ACK51216.1 nucleoside 2-deoxyribosyltransferase [Methylocella silvestris BL2]